MSSSNNTTIVLFNYGGGMRGLIPAHFMARIEKATGLHMTDMVDIFTGPSTGAILNAALNVPGRESDPANPLHRPRFQARHMVRFYEREGLKIFPPDRFRSFRGFIHDFNNRTMRINQLNSLFKHGHYNPGHLSLSLQRLYGEHKLSDSLKSLVIPVYNIDGDQLKALSEKGESGNMPVHTKNNFLDEGGFAVWLKNMKQEKYRGSAPDVKLSDAVLASCAAPTYFPCHHFDVAYPDHGGRKASYSGIDGSIFDNPCITWHGAVRRHLPKDERVIMIVLGTGYTRRSFKKEDWNRYGGLGVVDPVNDLPLINILFHAPESALVESFSQEMGHNLYVFNKSMISNMGDPDAPSSQIDDASPENLQRLERFTDSMIEENKQRFHEICHLLVRNRDQNIKKKENAWKALNRSFYFVRSLLK